MYSSLIHTYIILTLSNIIFVQVLEAARQAHVTHFTDDLPQGLQTQVGSRGTQISGGQKQVFNIM